MLARVVGRVWEVLARAGWSIRTGEGSDWAVGPGGSAVSWEGQAWGGVVVRAVEGWDGPSVWWVSGCVD